MNEIKNRKFPLERDLYGIQNSKIINCRFEGVEDGESALKETKDIIIKKCYFDLRYPIWHFNNVKIYDSEMTTSCRAALWYGDYLKIKRSKLNGIKVVRECKNVRISDSEINSQEFAWNSNLKEMFEFFDMKEDDESFDANTVSGFVTEFLGEIPVAGKTFEYKNLKIDVMKSTVKRVLQIKVTVNKITEE